MLALFETLFDIIRLRKGPDAIPHSSVLLSIIIGLWIFAGLVMTLMTPELDEKDDGPSRIQRIRANGLSTPPPN